MRFLGFGQRSSRYRATHDIFGNVVHEQHAILTPSVETYAIWSAEAAARDETDLDDWLEYQGRLSEMYLTDDTRAAGRRTLFQWR